MKIIHRLFIGFILVLMMFVATELFVSRHFNMISSSLRGTEEREIPSLVAALEIQAAARQASIKALEYSIRGDAHDKSKAYEALNKLDEGIESLHYTHSRSKDSVEGESLTKSIETAIINLKTKVTEFIALKDADKPNSEIFQSEQMVHKTRSELIHLTYDKVSAEQKEVDHAFAGTRKHISDAAQETLLLGVFSLIATIVIGWVLSRSIVRPLAQLNYSAQQIGQGNFDISIAGYGKDELGDLSTAFKVMLAELKVHRDGLESLVEKRTTELDQVILQLEQEIDVKQTYEKELSKHRDYLEALVGERTEDLEKTNQRLRKEINERQRAEEQLSQSQKIEAIGTMAGGIAHDFNNLLASIIGYAELANRNIKDEKKVSAYLAEVLRGTSRATDLVKQILTFSRKGEHKLEPLYPSRIINESLKLLRASLPASVQINKIIEEDSVKILADPTKMQQVILNLCTNAFHAMENEEGLLTIKLSREELISADIANRFDSFPGPYMELSISDTGCGIDKKAMGRIFEPYFTTKETGKGTGMGLAVVHGIVKEYGGFIGVESEPEKGTTFRVCIPAIEEFVAGKEQIEPSHTPELAIGTERILIVDDEEQIASMQKDFLESLGYQVTAFVSSKEAMEWFKLYPNESELLITDQTMPELTGGNLAKEILTISPDFPIILCTGHSTVMSEKEAKDIGIMEFFSKPVKQYDLARLVRKALDYRQVSPAIKKS